MQLVEDDADALTPSFEGTSAELALMTPFPLGSTIRFLLSMTSRRAENSGLDSTILFASLKTMEACSRLTAFKCTSGPPSASAIRRKRQIAETRVDLPFFLATSR